MTGGSWRLATSINIVGVNAFNGSVNPSKVSDGSAVIQNLAFGTGFAKMDTEVLLQRSLAPGTSETWNLYDGTTPDVFNFGATFRTLKGVLCWVSAGGDASGLTIGGGASNPCVLFFGGTTPNQTVYAGGPPASGGSPLGIAVTATTCNVKITNNAAVATEYTLYLVGSKAASGAAMGVLGLTYP